MRKTQQPMRFRRAGRQAEDLASVPGGTLEQGDFRDRLCRRFAADVEQRTGSALKFDIYPNSSLVKVNSQFSALRRGALDLSLVPLSYAGGEVAETNIGLLPALVPSYDVGTRWKTAEIGRLLTQMLAEMGVVVVSWIWQAGGVASRARPLVTPDDAKGMKVRGGSREMDMMFWTRAHMTRFAFALCAALCSIGVAAGADPTGYRKAYFGPTKPGSFAQYTMKIEGQPDMGSRATRLPDEGGQQRVQMRIDYQAGGAPTIAFTNYSLKPGYSLETDALGYGKALAAMSVSSPGAKPTAMPAAALENARRTMPDYAASAVFIGTDNVGGRETGHYRYVQRHPGTPEQIETGEIWLNETVPFGLVKQKAVTAEPSGKVVSQFELLLVDSGGGSAPASAADAAAPAKATTAAPVSLAEAFKRGKVELAVTVVPGSGDGRSLSVGFRNKTDSVLHLAIPPGQTTLDVGSPLEKLQLVAASATALDIAPGTTSKAVMLSQTGTRRAIDGTFAVTVFEGTPLFSGSATMGTVGR